MTANQSVFVRATTCQAFALFLLPFSRLCRNRSKRVRAPLTVCISHNSFQERDSAQQLPHSIRCLFFSQSRRIQARAAFVKAFLTSCLRPNASRRLNGPKYPCRSGRYPNLSFSDHFSSDRGAFEPRSRHRVIGIERFIIEVNNRAVARLAFSREHNDDKCRNQKRVIRFVSRQQRRYGG